MESQAALAGPGSEFYIPSNKTEGKIYQRNNG